MSHLYIKFVENLVIFVFPLSEQIMKTTNNSTITTSWKPEGDYFEECNCKLICPCIFKEDPDEGYCNLTAAWHIQKGNYDKVNLDGLNVVALFHAPGNMLTGPKWKAAFYIECHESLMG